MIGHPRRARRWTVRTGSAIAIGCGVLAGTLPVAGAADPAWSASGTPDRDRTLVQTDAGPVRGTAGSNYLSFQGIPYAAAPVGDLRWAPPQRPATWNEPRDAGRPGPLCAQSGEELGRPSLAEDCLTVNVTAPRSVRPSRPVFVWLHGGSFKDGGGSLYGGQRLAVEGDMVVVTLNYRLGALGFLDPPALEGHGRDPGNLGLQDQQAALQWIQRNATAFGGNPDNITLAGESAGATSVCAQLASPAARGLFDRAILQSNQCSTRWSPENSASPRSVATARRQGLDLARTLGCSDPIAAADCLRTKSVSQILAVAQSGPGLGPVYGTPLLPMDPATAVKQGRIHRIPVMTGINRNEENFSVYGSELQTGHPTTIQEYRQQLSQSAGRFTATVEAEYGCHRTSCAGSALGAVLTDARHARPVLQDARRFSRYVPTFMYEFADPHAPWFSELPPSNFPQGAYHTSELPYLFDISWLQPLTPGQQRLSHSMIDYWTRFAHIGDPNSAELPLWRPFCRSHPYPQSLAPGSRGIGPDRRFARAHHLKLWMAISGA